VVSNTNQGEGGTMPHAMHVAIALIVAVCSGVAAGVIIAWLYRIICG
jgi:hypothetical protein